MQEYKEMAEESNAVTMFSLNDKFDDGDDDGGLENSEIVADVNSDTPIDQLHSRDVLEVLTANLSQKEKRIVVMYYYEGLTMKEIGRILDLTESRVCQIHSNVLARLREVADRKPGLVGEIGRATGSRRHRVARVERPHLVALVADAVEDARKVRVVRRLRPRALELRALRRVRTLVLSPPRLSTGAAASRGGVRGRGRPRSPTSWSMRSSTKRISGPFRCEVAPSPTSWWTRRDAPSCFFGRARSEAETIVPPRFFPRPPVFSRGPRRRTSA
jgi:hypothetical protein